MTTTSTIDQTKIQAAVRMLLEGLGVDPNDHNFDRTPQRVAKVYSELFEPKDTGYPVFDEQYTDMVLMRGYSFYTLCPHHLLPVEIRASVAYLPNGKVLGASKLMRLINDVSRYPMTQEALTDQILIRLQALTQHTSGGAAVFLEGEHGCFRIRGVKSRASLITLKYVGRFDCEPALQERFLRLVGR